MRILLAIGLSLYAGVALAQQQPLVERRIAAQIGALVILNTSQGVQIEQLQTALTVAQARVKALEDKYESKPAE
jgi:hypothetical protein